MPTIAGLRGTGDWAADQRPKNFREMILWLDPNGEAPLTALLSKMASESVDDAEFNWWEEPLGHVRVQCADVGGIDNVTTTLTVAAEDDDANPPLSGFKALVKGDLLLVEDNTGQGEIVAVTATPSSTSVTIQRGVAGSTAAAIAQDAFLTKIGNAFEEGSKAPVATNRNPKKLTNFCQIFKTVYDITETASRTRLRTGDPVKNDKKRKMFDHSRDLEMAFMFGRAFETTGDNGKPLRYTGGLNSFISTNRTVFSGGGTTFTEDNFIDALAPLFDHRGEGSGNERIAFVGNGGLNAVNKLARTSASTRVNFNGTVKAYGMKLQEWIIPQGTLFLRTHPLMNIHPVFKYSAFVVNPRGLIYRHLRDTDFKDNIQDNDEDTKKGQWLTECGLEVHHEKTMGYFGNMK